jgi:hypothetical protein
MRQRPWARLAAAVGGGAGLALLAPVLAAVGQVSPPAPVLEIGPTARLVAQGAAVAVPLRVVVTCPEGGQASVSVRVVQSVGFEVAHAFGNENGIPCNGTQQVLEVFATSEDFTLRPGPAFASASLFCGSPFPTPGGRCSATANREITIVGGGGALPTLPPVVTTVAPLPPTTTLPGVPNLGSFIEVLFALLGFPLGGGI